MCGPGQPRNWNDDVYVVNMQAVGTPPLQSPMLLFYCSPVKFMCGRGDADAPVFGVIRKKDYKLGKYGK